MKTTVTELLKHCNEDTETMNELLTRFKPLIMSYSRKSGWKIETEDMQSILTIKLIEIVRKMKVLDSEAKNVKYITTSLRNHFLDVVKKINRIESVEIVSLESVTDTGNQDEDETVFYDMIKGLDERKKEIIRLKFKEMYTDKEIADKLGISRQSVNKQLRATYKILTSTDKKD